MYVTIQVVSIVECIEPMIRINVRVVMYQISLDFYHYKLSCNSTRLMYVIMSEAPGYYTIPENIYVMK